ncbi:MBL fold metallo-hydrolase [Paenibacillus sp. JSM ZJ436]|uniref:MBL fold metallo-hydrolase n=1 Tax=Paenibacillus sp. JSM ZJ436 TaxID=3376190 RepID=UPI0037BAD744
MTLKLQMLGTGSAFSRKYFNNNALIFDENFTLMVDCGVTAPTALHQLGRSWDSIDAVLITHTHADHVGGLEELAFQMKMRYQRKIPLYLAEPLAGPLWENTLKGGLYQEKYIESLEDVFTVIPLPVGTPADLSPGITVELIHTRHIPGRDSYSLYLNGRVFYSADMTFDPQLLHQLVTERRCDTILHECQLEGEGQVHTTLSELLSLPEELQSNIHLMHYADNMEQFRNSTGLMKFLEQHRVYEL